MRIQSLWEPRWQQQQQQLVAAMATAAALAAAALGCMRTQTFSLGLSAVLAPAAAADTAWWLQGALVVVLVVVGWEGWGLACMKTQTSLLHGPLGAAVELQQSSGGSAVLVVAAAAVGWGCMKTRNSSARQPLEAGIQQQQQQLRQGSREGWGCMKIQSLLTSLWALLVLVVQQRRVVGWGCMKTQSSLQALCHL